MRVFALFLFLFLSISLFCYHPFSVFSFSKLSISKPELLQTQFVTSSDDVLPVVNRSRSSTLIRRSVGNLSEVEKLEFGLVRARVAIRHAMKLNVSYSVDKDAPSGAVYRNPGAFYRSYLEMEKRFKVYVYEEGNRPIVHGGPCKDIYTSEGRFIHEMELRNTRFTTKDARRAHVHFMPFSVSMMVKFIYQPNSLDKSLSLQFVSDYVELFLQSTPSGIGHKVLITSCSLAMIGVRRPMQETLCSTATQSGSYAMPTLLELL